MILLATSHLFGQNYLSSAKEKEIKISGNYFWEEGSDFDEAAAQDKAHDALSAIVITEVVNATLKSDVVLRAIEMGENFARLQEVGKVRMLAYIAKDSLFVIIKTKFTDLAVQATPQSTQTEPESQPSDDRTEKSEDVKPDSQPTTTYLPVESDNPIIQELSACKKYRDVLRVVRRHGLVTGNSAQGFANPENCVIAVFTADGTLTALLDRGKGARTDLMSGDTDQHPEQLYSKKDYQLLFMQIINH
jgi:hypothetical protein